jgi:hypothetical protein
MICHDAQLKLLDTFVKIIIKLTWLNSINQGWHGCQRA